MMRLIVGVVSFAWVFGFGAYYEYLQWFVHPDYTKPEMFWAYWHILVAMIPGAVVLYVVLPGGTRSRRS